MKKGVLSVVVLFLAVSSIVVANLSWAVYPEKKIRIIVGFAPGGGNDLTGRTLARYLNPHLGDRVYVENVPGAGGAIGYRECLKSKPDGYTLTIMSTVNLTGPLVTKGYPTYDLFDPICLLNLESRILVAKWGESRFKTAAELISYAKAHPGSVTTGTAGVGTINHFGMYILMDATGTEFTLVPFPSAGRSLVGLIGGHVDTVLTSAPGTVSFAEGKKIRPVLVLGEKRYPIYPDVPTAKELGYDALVVGFTGVGAPKGVPKAVKDTLIEALRKATEDEGYKTLMDKMGQERVFLGPDEASRWLKERNDFYRGMAAKVGIKPE